MRKKIILATGVVTLVSGLVIENSTNQDSILNAQNMLVDEYDTLSKAKEGIKKTDISNSSVGYVDDFNVHFTENTYFVMSESGRYASAQGQFLTHKETQQIVYCLNAFEHSGDVYSVDAEKSEFNTFSKEKQESILKTIDAANKLYEQTGDENYLVAGQLSVWSQNGTTINSTSENLKPYIKSVEEYSDVDLGGKKVTTYITKGQELLSLSSNSDTYGIFGKASSGIVITPEKDTVGPVISLNGDGLLTVQLNANITYGELLQEYGIKITDNVDGDIKDYSIFIDGKEVSSSDKVDTDALNSYEMTLRVVDSSSNESIENIVIQVINNVPILSLNDNAKTFVGSSDIDYIKLFDVEAFDAEDGDLTNEVVVDSSLVDTSKVGSYPVAFTVIDSDENTVVKTANVEVATNMAPVLSSTDASFEANDLTPSLTDAQLIENFNIMAMDQEDGDLTSSVVITENNIDYKKANDYKVKFEVTDSDGNVTSSESSLSVTTNYKPVLTVDSSATYEYSSIINPEDIDYMQLFNVSAMDNEQGDISDQVIVDYSSVVTTKQTGIYEILFTVTDIDGNKVVEKGILDLKSNFKPILVSDVKSEMFQMNESYSSISNAEYITAYNVSASDVEDGAITDIIVDDTLVDYKKAGTYKVKFSVIDSDENSEEIIRDVVIQTNYKPILNADATANALPGTYTESQLIEKFNVTAEDYEDGVITNISVDTAGHDLNVVGVHDIVFSVKDKDGNTTSKTSKLTIADDMAPVITYNKEAKNEMNQGYYMGSNLEADIIKHFEIQAKDAEDGELTSNISIDLNGLNVDLPGTYSVIASVTDSGNNTTVESIEVIILPVTVKTCDEFITDFRAHEKDAVFTLTYDVDCEGQELNDVPTGEYYTKTFDGNGHTIRNFTTSKGIFGDVAGSIKNININNATVSNDTEFTGILAGKFNDGVMENIVINNSTVIGSKHVGGAVGRAWDADLNNIQVTNTKVNGDTRVGAVAGGIDGSSPMVISDLHVSDSSIIGESTTGLSEIGGVVGYSNNGLTDISATNTYVKGFDSVGGAVGAISKGNSSNFTVTGAEVEGIAKGDSVGGALGRIDKDSSIDNMSVDQSVVTGHMDLGGIIGSINGGNASNLKVDNTSVDANGKTIGGAIGWQSGIVDGVTVNNVEVRGPRQVGGVVGKIDLDADGNTKSTLTNAVSDANITATYNGLFPIDDKNISSFFGGIAGMADQSSVNGDFTGNISDPNGYFDASKSRVGTLVGASYASAVDGEDKNSEVVGKYEKIGYTSDQPVTR